MLTTCSDVWEDFQIKYDMIMTELWALGWSEDDGMISSEEQITTTSCPQYNYGKEAQVRSRLNRNFSRIGSFVSRLYEEL